MRRAQNVDPIDLEVIDNADARRDLAVGNDLIVNLFPELRIELLGIVQLSMPEFRRQNNRRSDDWPRQRATSCFIDSGDSNDSSGA